jgi:nicotinate-nucleotide adenylyltransferase
VQRGSGCRGARGDNPAALTVRLGIFGGTFDPPHNGHLLAASDAIEALELETLWFVPNASQPLKGPGHGSPRQRLEMVRLLTAGDDRFAVDPVEVDRHGVSYTVDTLAEFASRFPRATRFLLIGADVAGTFDQWREPQRIRDLAEVVVLQRATDPGDGTAASAHSAPRGLEGARWLKTRRVDVSSTEIRDRVHRGKSIRGFVPDTVAAYIAAARLYQ